MQAINLVQVRKIWQELECECRILEVLQRRVQDVGAALPQAYGSEVLWEGLQRQSGEIRWEQELLRQMSLVLQEACNTYERAENRIADYAEEVRFSKGGQEFSQWQIPEWLFDILNMHGKGGER